MASKPRAGGQSLPKKPTQTFSSMHPLAFVDKVRNFKMPKFPKPTTIIVFSVVLGFMLGNRLRNRTQEATLQAHIEAAKELGARPLGVLDTSKRVVVLVDKQSWGSWAFDKYARPIFDAAGLDYDVIKTDPVDPVAPISTRVHAGKAARRAIVTEDRREASKEGTVSFTAIAEAALKYVPRCDAVVTLGDHVYAQALTGAADFVRGSGPGATPDEDEVHAYEFKKSSQQDISSDESLVDRNVRAARFPPIARIPFSYPGWFSWYFSETKQIESITSAALGIAWWKIKRFEQTDLETLKPVEISPEEDSQNQLEAALAVMHRLKVEERRKAKKEREEEAKKSGDKSTVEEPAMTPEEEEKFKAEEKATKEYDQKAEKIHNKKTVRVSSGVRDLVDRINIFTPLATSEVEIPKSGQSEPEAA